MHKTFLVMWIIFLPCLGYGQTDPVTLGETVTLKKGVQQTLVTVKQLGRYEFSAKSPTGSSLQIVSRRRGPGVQDGVIGKQDGVLRVLLQAGDYRLISRFPNQSKQAVELSVRGYTELNRHPRQLIDYKVIAATLENYQQISYWIDIKKRRTITVDAAGRSLADLRLWKNGNWLVNDKPNQVTIEPRAQQPLNNLRLEMDLTPGLYRLTAYGGPAVDWGSQDGSRPFYIRMGIPRLPQSGKRRMVTSAFGIDRWQVPRSANYFQLSLPQAGAADLWIKQMTDSGMLGMGGRHGAITKKSRVPAVDMKFSSGEGDAYYVVTVKRQAGQPYTLQHFMSKSFYAFSKSGRYWISSIHAGNADDQVDANSIILSYNVKGNRHPVFVDKKIITLGATAVWQRRFNLLSPVELFVEVSKAGEYQTRVDHGKAAFKFEPYFIKRPRNYRSPDFRDSGSMWQLNAGMYRLTMRPKRDGKGASRVSITPKNVPAGDADTTVLAENHYRVDLDKSRQYVFYPNRRREKSGLVLRPWPVDISRALPVTLSPGQHLDMQVVVPGHGRVEALDLDGRAVPLSVNGKTDSGHTVNKGRHTIVLSNPSDQSQSLSLRFVDQKLLSPLPAFDTQQLARLPALPVLSETKPLFLDMARNETQTFRVDVAKAGMYRVESSGLLHTQGRIRTRTSLRLNKDDQLGVARNFLIQAYLIPGQYQVQVSTLGKTQGRLGVHLNRTPMVEGGRLPMGIPARKKLRAAEGALFQFSIQDAGRYRLQTFGLNKQWRMRFEDNDGWPVTQPGGVADFSTELGAGEYRVMVLPQAVASQLIAKIDKLNKPPSFSGHGPHHLPLDQTVEHIWHEPQEDQPRSADRWHIVWPAEADATVNMDGDMLLQIVDGLGNTVVEEFRKQWRGPLKKGEYDIVTRSRRPNNLLPYRISVSPSQLMVGQRMQVDVPGHVDIAIGEKHMVEIHSLGKLDVSAKLFDNRGKLLLQQDDTENDWNFNLASELEPGRYRLQINTVGEQGTLSVALFTPKEQPEKPVTLPATWVIKNNRLHSYPIQPPAGSNFMMVSGRSLDETAMRLEIKQHGHWQVAGSVSGRRPVLAVPLHAGVQAYRLGVWSKERRQNPIHVKAAAFVANAQTEHGSGRYSPQKLVLDDRRWGITRLTLLSPGVFLGKQSAGGMLYSTGEDQVLAPVAGLRHTITGQQVWMLREDLASVDFQRVTLRGHDAFQITVPAKLKSHLDINAARTPLLVRAHTRFGVAGLAPTDVDEPGTWMDHLDGTTVLYLPPEQTRKQILLWNAQAGQEQPLIADVRALPLTRRKGNPIKSGRQTIPIQQRQVVSLGGQHLWQLLVLDLPPLTAVQWYQNNEVKGIFWAGEQSRYVSIPSAIDRVDIIHAGVSAVSVALTAFPKSRYDAFSPETVWKSHAAVSGTLLLPIHGLSQSHIQWRGAITDVMVIGNEGSISASPMPVDAGRGRLKVVTQPGWMAMWQQGDQPSPWPSQQTRIVAFPSQWSLDSKIEEFVIKRDQSAMIHMRADAPVLLRLQRPDQPAEVVAYQNGGTLSWYAPKGRSVIQVQSANRGKLNANLDFTLSGIHALQEGLGEPHTLAPGDSMLFSFKLQTTTQIGVGVRAEKDLLACALLNSQGKELGQGVVQMHELNAGTYLLRVESSPKNPGIRFQPALVGSTPPQKGPPEDVIKQYLQQSDSAQP